MQPDATSEYWWVGVLCSLLACFGTVAGMLVQKYSHMKEEALPPELRNPWYRRPMWWASLVLMIIIPSPLDIASFALAPQSLLAPLSAVTLLLNAVMAPWWLGEKLTRIDLYATVLIFAGASVSTFFGDHAQRVYTVPTLLQMFRRHSFVAFQVVSCTCIVGLYLFVRAMGPVKERWDEEHLLGDGDVRQEDHSSSIMTDVAQPDSNGGPSRRVNSSGSEVDLMNEDESFLVERKTPAQPGVLLQSLPFAYGLLAGLAGAQQMVITKCVSELVSKTIEGQNQFQYGLTFLLIALAIGFAIFQIGYLSKGLSFYDATFFLPIYNAFLIILGVVTGGVYFDEFASVTALKLVLFATGVSVTLAGVLLLTQRPLAIRNRLGSASLSASDSDSLAYEERKRLLGSDRRISARDDDDDDWYDDGPPSPASFDL